MDTIDQIKQDITITTWQMVGMRAVAAARGMSLTYGTSDSGAHMATLALQDGMQYTVIANGMDEIMRYMGACIMEQIA